MQRVRSLNCALSDHRFFLAAPRLYREDAAAILDCQIALLRASLEAGDQGFIFAEGAQRERCLQALPADSVIDARINDIWLRDFAPVVGKRPCAFVYSPGYELTMPSPLFTQAKFLLALSKIGLGPRQPENRIRLDGGNLVYNGAGIGIVSARVFAENREDSPQTVQGEIQKALALDRLIVIPDDPLDVTGHADGLVAFLDERRLFLSSPDEALLQSIRRRLGETAPEIELTELPCEDHGESARGCYVNYMLTRNALYAPVYNLPADDLALGVLREHSSRQVLPIEANAPAMYGGSLHCMSWQPLAQS